MNETFLFNYDYKSFKCSYLNGETFAHGLFDNNKIEFSNGASLMFVKRTFDRFHYNRKFSLKFDNIIYSISFKMLKLKGEWVLNFRGEDFFFKMKRGYRTTLSNENKIVGDFDLNELKLNQNVLQYKMNCENEIQAIFLLAFLLLFIVTPDTEGTRLPSTFGNLG